MSRYWAAGFLAVVISLTWCLQVEAVYHVLSMKNFSPPPDVKVGSLFGFSIAYQPKTKKLMTSAPKFSSGNIYECDLEIGNCYSIPVIDTRDYEYPNMWLGATVAAGHNFTVACAPRYIMSLFKVGTFGKCYALSPGAGVIEMKNNTDDFVESPFEQNFNTLGWSLNVDRHDSVVVGGPIMRREIQGYGLGQGLSLGHEIAYYSEISRGRAMVYKNIREAPEFAYHKNINAIFNYGYSVTSGNFLSADEDSIVYAISTTYGSRGFGRVTLTDLKSYWILVYPRAYVPAVGSQFGAVLASATLRGKGQRQALLVGAPRYARKGRLDVGAVYIYQYNVVTKTVTHQKTILGKQDNGLFGSAIISVGDLNGDNKDEIAVSAPYEDSGKGAVYIYSGGHLLSDVADNMLEPLQKLQPEGFRAFGLSLAALQDYDGNGCNELSIGVPYSDQIVYLKCMPKIKITVLNLQKLESPHKNDTHFVFNSCINVDFPSKPESITADILLTISLIHENAKLAGSTEKNGQKIKHKLEIRNKKSPLCKEVGINIPKVIDYNPSIQYHIKVFQMNSPEQTQKFDPTHALLSDLSKLNVAASVWVADCAGVDECKPNFKLTFRTSLKNDYVIGSSDTENIIIEAYNSGDTAYSACVVIGIEAAERGLRVTKWPPTCVLVYETQMRCVPQRPVENNTSWITEQLQIDMRTLKSNVKEVHMQVHLYPHCNANDKIVIKSSRKFKVLPDVKGIVIIGPKADTIELTSTELLDTGKHTQHIYTVHNFGKTTWVNIRLRIVMLTPRFFNDTILTVETYAASQGTSQCDEVKTSKDGLSTTCVVSELRPGQNFDVIVPIHVQPGTIDPEDIEDKNDKEFVSTKIFFDYEDYTLEKSAVSYLLLKKGVVPIWVIIIAALVGLFIIIIIAFALYEFGFLRRKNKDKLKKLRRSVHRQSIRRSMALRESMRTSAASERRSGDREKLISANESESDNKNTKMTKNNENPLKNNEDLSKSNDGQPKGEDVQPRNNSTKKPDSPKKPTQLNPKGLNSPQELKKDSDLDLSWKPLQNDKGFPDEDTGVQESDNDACKKIKGDQIIRGLQKNIGSTISPHPVKKTKGSASSNTDI